MKNLIYFFILFPFLINAQTQLSGTAHSRSGEPMVGANVFLPTTYEGGMVDENGQFQFNTTAKGVATLVIQHIGYATDSVKINMGKVEPVNFKLRPAISTLSEVVITAGAMEASDTRKTAVLSSIDVVTTGATGDLAEAMSILPGTMQEGETGELLVRGGSADETQAFINGLRIPQLFTANIPDVPSRSRFSPFDFRGITFATGGFSAEFGDAMSAALILETQNMPDEEKLSIGLMTLAAQGAYTKLFDNQALTVAATYTDLGLYRHLNQEAKERIVESPRGGEVQLGYWWENDRKGLLKVYAKTSTTDYLGQDSSSIDIYGGEKIGIQNNFTYGQVVYQEPLGKNGFWEAGFAQNYDYTDYGVDETHFLLTQHNSQLRLKMTGQHKEVFKWKAGWTAERLHETFDLDIDEKINYGDVKRWSSALYGEIDWFISKDWLVRAGLRGDYYENEDLSVNPRFQVSRVFSEKEQMVLSGGRYRQRLVPQDYFATPFETKAAYADHLMLTYFRNMNNRVFRMEAYYKKYHQLSLYENGMLTDAGSGFARGVDFFFRDRQTFKETDIWMSFSLVDSQRKWLNVQEKVPVSFSAPQVLSVVYKKFFPKPKLGMSLTYRWHSGRPYQNPNLPGFNQQRAPQFHDLSASLYYLTNIKDNFTVFFISMTNVPKFEQTHTYRYADTPDDNGVFRRQAVTNLFPRFPFMGMFMDIGKKEEQLGVEDF